MSLLQPFNPNSPVTKFVFANLLAIPKKEHEKSRVVASIL